ncbi:beta-glucosidase BglX [Bacteroides sp. 519]|uniref:beta-glucosidase BglX n=1 Tax=Bacteroides sp. 519 TaxID=2302937 RepID=UPI0013D7F036|nr:beta-glucosidase BglX [Bacteroides sp. 519]NDV57039.1 beta-glucosidase BglX [Bacteroides sp. 519]
MKKFFKFLFVLFSCHSSFCLAQNQTKEMDQFVSNLLSQMTLEEKIGQMNLSSGSMGAVLGGGELLSEAIQKGEIGATGGFSYDAAKKIQDAAQKSRLKIPILIGMDVIHGYKTIFPIPLGLSCSWDLELIEQSARIAAIEASAAGVCWTYSPMVDISRDPRWGRVSEGSGEDPWWGAQVAKAMVRGYQGDDLTKNNTIMACVKHIALYGAGEAGRDYNTVDMSHLSMFNDYFPPYKAAFDEGAGSGMTSFNLIDGIPASGSKWMMTEVLRNRWEFNGFVVTDYTSIPEMINHGLGNLKTVSALALDAGVDMDMQGDGFMGTLKTSLNEGTITMTQIDQACRRILEAKYRLGLFDDPYRYLNPERWENEIQTEDHLDAARKIAARSMVLLKNDRNTLPLKKKGKIAVVGPFAEAKPDMLGAWVLIRDAKSISSVVEGIKNVGGNAVEVVTAKGSNITDGPYLKTNLNSPFAAFMGVKMEDEPRTPQEMLEEALQVSSDADVIVAVLGESSAMSGEASSRAEIDIPKSQRDLLKSLINTGKPVVLVLINGRPLTLNWEVENVPAILEAWAPGTEAGNAIADVLFGNYNPAGKLTMTFPRSVGQIPLYYNHKNTGRPFDENNKFTSKYLDIPNEALFPFGFGLSYTTFEYGDIALNKTKLSGNDKLTASVTLTNTGGMAGEEVVQLYIKDPVATISRPVKELKNFRKVMLQPGEKKEIIFEVTSEDLKFYNSELFYDWEPGEFEIQIGTNSCHVKKASITWKK